MDTRPLLSASHSPRGVAHYLRDRDVQLAGVVSVLLIVLSGGVIWLAYLLRVWLIARRSPLQPAQAMVVLVFGQRLRHDRPAADFEQRLQRTLDLLERRRTGHVLLLGGCSGGSVSEAQAALTWLTQHGLPAGAQVELEQESVDSLENLHRARELLLTGSEALPPVALVSSRYHLARCLLLARRLGFDAVPVAAEAALSWRPRYLLRLCGEAGYVMWIDIGMRLARVIGYRRMSDRIS